VTRYVNPVVVCVFRNKLNARALWELGEEDSDTMIIRRSKCFNSKIYWLK